MPPERPSDEGGATPPPTPPRRRLSAGRRLGYAALATVAALALLELGARLVERPLLGRVRARHSSAPFRFDPVTKWALAPGSPIAECPPDRPAALRAAETVISPEGYRDTPLVEPRPDGLRRVLCLGDSSVYGAGVCRAETFAERLEAALAPGVEVIDAGVPGYSSYQCLEQLRQARAHGPDGVVVYCMQGDLEPIEGLGDAVWFGHGSPLHRPLARTALYRVTRELYDGARAPTAPRDGAATRRRSTLAQFRANLHRLIDEAATAGAWVVLVVPPVRADLGALDGRAPPAERPTDAAEADATRARLDAVDARGGIEAANEDYAAAIALVGWERGVPLVDGPAVLREAMLSAREDPAARPDPGRWFLDAVHPSPAGHAALADSLAPVLRRQLDPTE